MGSFKDYSTSATLILVSSFHRTMRGVFLKQLVILVLVSSTLSTFVQKDVMRPLTRIPRTTTIGKEKSSKTGAYRVCCMAMDAGCLACSSGQSIHEYCEHHPETTGCPKEIREIGCCKAFTVECEACRKGMSMNEFCKQEPQYFGCSTENEKEDFGNNKEICKDDKPKKCKKLAKLCKKRKIQKHCRLTCGLCKPNSYLKVDEPSDTCKL